MQEIYYVTSNEGKFVEVQRFLAEYAPQITLKGYLLDLEELQLTDENAVLKHKALSAWKAIEQPLLVDDAGIYLQAYPKFPGTLTKPVLNSLGYKGIYELARHDNRTYYYVGLAFVQDETNIHYFRAETAGYIIQPKGPVSYPYTLEFYAHFYPEKSSKSLAQLWNDQSSWIMSPRVKVSKQFADWLAQKAAYNY